MTTANTRTRARNPLVAAALFRRAGVHRRSAGGQRQQMQRALRAELGRDDRPADRRSALERERHRP